MTFLINFLKALAESLGVKAAPFALAESKALLELGLAYAETEIDLYNGSDEERKLARDAVVAELHDFITACKEEGKDLESDIIGLLFSAGGSSLLTDFGFDKNEAQNSPS